MGMSSNTTKVRKPRFSWMARRSDVLTSDYCVRFERQVPWLRNPVAALALAMVASLLCAAGLALAPWYDPVARQAACERGAALERLVRLADWAPYAPDRPGLAAPCADTTSNERPGAP